MPAMRVATKLASDFAGLATYLNHGGADLGTGGSKALRSDGKTR